jgi:hypothetical protein
MRWTKFAEYVLCAAAAVSRCWVRDSLSLYSRSPMDDLSIMDVIL